MCTPKSLDQATIRALIQEVQAGTDMPACRSWAINLLWSKLDEESAAITSGGATYAATSEE